MLERAGTLLVPYEMQSVNSAAVPEEGNLLRLNNLRSSLHYFLWTPQRVSSKEVELPQINKLQQERGKDVENSEWGSQLRHSKEETNNWDTKPFSLR